MKKPSPKSVIQNVKVKKPNDTQVHVYPKTVAKSVSYRVIWAEATLTLFTLFSDVSLMKGTQFLK